MKPFIQTNFVMLSMVALLANSANIMAQMDTVTVSDELQLVRLSENVYQHISILKIRQQAYPCNGLVYIHNGKVVVIDTPVTIEQSNQLIGWIEAQNMEVIAVVPCHWHVDCLGGIGAFHARGIESYCLQQTYSICQQKGLPLAQHAFIDSLCLKVGSGEAYCYYPGGGHTADNIVVYLPSEKILFGGCLVKAMHQQQLGNLDDAIIGEWEASLTAVQSEFPDAMLVVPGHGAVGNLMLLDHTKTLVQRYRADLGQ